MSFDKTIPLNEYITLQRGFDLPKNDRVEGDVPVVASTGIGGYHNEAKVTAPGVVIGRSGSIGGGQYITEDFWPLNTTLWVKDFKNHHPRYVYYLLKSIDFTQFNVGSGVPTLNRNHLSSVLVADIGKSEEELIAKIAGDLDEKIKLNTQLNQTLEQIAQAIFKSWFVDFEPVKAKMAVLEAGLPAPVRISDGPREGIFCTYVIECDDGSYYIGQTDNLKRRWREHLSGKGAQWTKTHKPLQIAHFEENSSREEAVAKEKNWKTTAGRRELKKLIASGAARQAGGTAEQAELAAMSVISAKDEAALKQLQAEQPGAYAELAQTAALFPSAMEESALGEIPEGWEPGILADVASYAADRIAASEITVENYVSTENMLENKRGISVATALPGGKTVPLFEEGHVLVSNIRPYFKKIWFAHFNGGRSPDVLGFVSKDSEAREFLFNFLYQDLFFEFMMTTSKGAKMPRGDKDAIMGYELALPSQAIRRAYSNSVRSYYEAIESLNAENKSLVGTRDSLLPKLLAGHLPITNTGVA